MSYRRRREIGHWADHAECATAKTEIFFPTDGDYLDARAALICGRCPVRATCLEWALNNAERGIWAGTTEKDRRRIRRHRTRAAVSPSPASDTR